MHGQPSLLPLRVGGWGRAKFCLLVTWPAQPTTPTGVWLGTRQILPFGDMAGPGYYPYGWGGGGWVGWCVGVLVGGAGGS